MKSLFSLLLLAFACPAFAADAYPVRPDPSLTPGSLCSKPDSKRYPEGIPYCSRNVGGDLKREVMETNDAKLGFHVTQMKRTDFKIDHYLPLCMGGSNNSDNLWPQNQSVYTVTDPLEQIACDKMAKGVLRQSDAVDLIKRAKADLSQVPAILAQVRAL